jgi:hypothetical protein
MKGQKMIDLRGNPAMEFVMQVRGEFWLFNSGSSWNCHIKCYVDGLKIEVTQGGCSIEETVAMATNKFMKAITPIRPMLQPALEAPSNSFYEIPETTIDGGSHILGTDKDIPF